MPTLPRSRRLRRYAPVAALTSCVLLTTAACGGAADKPAAGTDKLALAVLGAPNSFEVTQLSDGQPAYIWNSVYDTLLYTDNKGQLQPNAAESWGYTDGGRTLTLKLRTGMKFSNGHGVNAAGVKASLDYVRTTPGSQQNSLDAIDAIEAPDDTTVVLKLKHPDASLLPSLSMGAGAIADPETMKDPSAALNPIGSGPYILDKAATVNGSSYLLKKRDDYWNAAAYPFETVEVKVMGDRTAAVNALQDGQLNAGTVESTQVDQVKGAGFDVTVVPATSVGTLVLADRDGSVVKPLSDVRVRQAINMAFDRQKMVSQFLRGVGRPTAQIVNPKSAEYDPALDTAYPFDPAAAKKLLADAGYADGFSVTMPSLYYTKPFEPTIGQALKDIGIEVTWEPVPAQNNSIALTSGKYGMYFTADGLNAVPNDAKKYFSPQGIRNPFHTQNPEISGLLLEASGEQDPAKATDAFKKINTYGTQNAWYAPVFYIGSSWVTKKGITYLGDGSSTLTTIRAFGTAS
ncbi:ABC transporter substrate-binding protein [Yinghuangia sp. ASG 101]|uniref:ABC transporter substrate-binding protein n=1 Tax=Yinghuangia sp. ASG 101 TaxID=2896848 RepID=UPI001E51CE4B|nr:ABC transporter substrate-binding protein [Yinghuangia sp. ASG 101]UGQ13445.1 ABC transporter substrate-binding protein [Yinghuangia sp. ASG 101]